MAAEQLLMQALPYIKNQITGRLAVGGSLLATAGGAIGAAVNTKKANEEENRYYEYAKEHENDLYNNARSFLNQQYYRDPLSMTGTRSLLKVRDEQRRDNLEGMNNLAVASGATVENRLAAMKAENATDSRLTSQLLQGEDARRDRLAQQQLSLTQQHSDRQLATEQQHSANVRNQYYQKAQTWQNWGAALSDAIMQYGAASMMDTNSDFSQYGQLLGQLG